MAHTKRSYLCIDLKSFYASAECVARGLDPLTTNLVVADPTRTDKTICLAVSPALKKLGVPGRCRLFQIPKNIKYIIAPPRMRYYLEKSVEIYGIYLRRIAAEDIFVYSIDEAFFDITSYLKLYNMTPRELGESLRSEVAKETGITATCGLGTNLYLAKVALDITAKHTDDFFGELDQRSFEKTFWNHRPLTDFWRIGPGIAQRLERMGITTMGQLAHAPTEPLYREFGVDAEILIDHAWGIEPLTMQDIKNYKPQEHSYSSNQVFAHGYSYKDTLLCLKEMADQTALRLVEEKKLAGGISIYVGYEMTRKEKAEMRVRGYTRLTVRRLSPSTSASRQLIDPTNSSKTLVKAASELFNEKVDPHRSIKRLGIGVWQVCDEEAPGIQLSLFSDPKAEEQERNTQRALSDIKAKFGKNAILKGRDYLPQATLRERNQQIGGHRSGDEKDRPHDVIH